MNGHRLDVLDPEGRALLDIDAKNRAAEQVKGLTRHGAEAFVRGTAEIDLDRGGALFALACRKQRLKAQTGVLVNAFPVDIEQGIRFGRQRSLRAPASRLQ